MSNPSHRNSSERKHEITQQSLPLCCPLPTNRLWDAHPRVYLPIAKTNPVTCPYCGTEYILRT